MMTRLRRVVKPRSSGASRCGIGGGHWRVDRWTKWRGCAAIRIKTDSVDSGLLIFARPATRNRRSTSSLALVTPDAFRSLALMMSPDSSCACCLTCALPALAARPAARRQRRARQIPTRASVYEVERAAARWRRAGDGVAHPDRLRPHGRIRARPDSARACCRAAATGPSSSSSARRTSCSSGATSTWWCRSRRAADRRRSTSAW